MRNSDYLMQANILLLEKLREAEDDNKELRRQLREARNQRKTKIVVKTEEFHHEPGYGHGV